MTLLVCSTLSHDDAETDGLTNINAPQTVQSRKVISHGFSEFSEMMKIGFCWEWKSAFPFLFRKGL